MTSIINASTTAGVIITSDTSGNLALQTGGGTYTQTVPNATGTVMVSGNMPAFSAYGTAGQSIANGVWTKIAYNTKLFDTNTNYDATTNYRFTPTVAGYYQINAVLFTTANATGLAFVAIYKNGSAYCYGNVVPNSNGGYITANGLVYCNGSTDYIEIYVFQNSGVSLNFGSSSSPFQFSGSMVRSA